MEVVGESNSDPDSCYPGSPLAVYSLGPRNLSFLSMGDRFIQIIDIVLYLTMQYPW